MAKNIGSAGNDYCSSIEVDAMQNIYTTGIFGLTADFDPGPGTYTISPVSANFDMFISKLDINGYFVFAKQVGINASSLDKCELTVDASLNTYITGKFNSLVDFDPGPANYTLSALGSSNIFVLKIDAIGNFIWAREMGGISGEAGISIALDAANNVYTTGYYNFTADFDPGLSSYSLTSAGSQDIFISKLDAAGNFAWAGSIGSTSYEYPLGIDVDAIGNIYTTGFFSATCDFDPGVGVFNLIDNGSSDAFILKLHQQPLKVNENNKNDALSIYPNPTSNSLNLSGYTFTENSIISIYNTLGEKVSSCKPEEINLGDLKNGIYFLQLIENEKLISVKRIIKE